MYRFFVDSEQFENSEIIISGDDYNHICNVLRMKIGEEILLSDGNDREYMGIIDRYDENAVYVRVTDVMGISRELPSRITLFQGYPKGDKMEQIVKKAVELGVYEIVPVMMNRCVVKFDDKKASKKVERLNAVSLSAAKQSKRGIIPNVKSVMNMESAIDYARNLDYVIMPYENAEGMEYSRQIISAAKGKASIGIFIGPEGGFDKAETDMLSNADAKIISLGHRILRTETAGITVLALLMYMLDD